MGDYQAEVLYFTSEKWHGAPASAALGLEPGAQPLTWPSGITWWQFAHREVTDVL